MAKKVTKKPTSKKQGTTRKKTASKKSANGASMNTAVTEEQIRARAFEIYRAGVNPSNPDADWLQAEQELRGESIH